MGLVPERQRESTIGRKLWQINWSFVLLIALIAGVGFAMLYSAADGQLDPWSSRQMARFGFGLVAMIVFALIDIRTWLRYAYFIYFASLVLLAAVEVTGSVGMGAQRWINLGFINVQPSEIVKITLILALARYFYASRVEDVERMTHLFVPAAMLAVPVFLVLRQPDLGTAILILVTGITIFFLAGVRAWIFVATGLAAISAIVPVWKFVLLDYQKQRLLTYLNPESDPLGAGYHVMQSKIALGSGGLFGKGFLSGTQSHLSFLPEKHTDFIFTMLAEEFGMAGGLGLVGLYLMVLVYGFFIAVRSRNHFGRLVGMGVVAAFFYNVFVNIAMVMGLLPVVGMPLPLVSYGGTAMVTLLFGFGLLLCVFVHRDVTISPGTADGNY
ncbi:MAG: rod shape-determining protein RodA [Rhodospirillaceae bacterium]|jgi:rod shape determining protein RodA|nr:rod shape-determining protein RodA [Rhodospirillaceae bacterium]MBT4115462.1 rod shape-determining protein RodA [Rhodospirillaceae bacterium]MBT4672385.1 rod shape-determining protein RodA [Rhodospirillaceae bacterium]MBT4719037.1 rod shape-determining protein RodA [Rhodospirillaceae bacterium]MBT4751575.1 rod shape-determining protein RodA [Rhodospirillaceae bacterium]